MDFLSLASPSNLPSRGLQREHYTIMSLMTLIQESELSGNNFESSRLYAILRNPEKIPMKLLKFSDDVRPGYIGTWTKHSSVVTGRRPFAKDVDLLDYEYDSEAEWDDDPEDAEDVDAENMSVDGDEVVMSDSEDDLDGWLGESHMPYLSDNPKAGQ